jgi:DNA polymerase III delta prime subunit
MSKTDDTQTDSTTKKERMNQIQRMERRREMMSLIVQGYPLSVVADAIEKKYRVPADVVYKDWQRREKWLPLLYNIDKPDALVNELLTQMHTTIEKAWETHREAMKDKNANAAVGALRCINETSQRIVETLQSLGKITQKPIQVQNIMVKGRWWEKDNVQPKQA